MRTVSLRSEHSTKQFANLKNELIGKTNRWCSEEDDEEEEADRADSDCKVHVAEEYSSNGR